jgi:hypothetical protein
MCIYVLEQVAELAQMEPLPFTHPQQYTNIVISGTRIETGIKD